MKGSRILLIFVLAGVMFFTGCGDSDDNQGPLETSAPTTHVAVRGNIDYNQGIDVISHISCSITVNVYDNLGNRHPLTINFGELLYGAPGAGSLPESHSYQAVQIPAVTPEFGSLDLPVAGCNSADQIYAEFDQDQDGRFKRLVKVLMLDATRNILTVGPELGDTDITISVSDTGDVVLPISCTDMMPVRLQHV